MEAVLEMRARLRITTFALGSVLRLRGVGFFIHLTSAQDGDVLKVRSYLQ